MALLGAVAVVLAVALISSFSARRLVAAAEGPAFAELWWRQRRRTMQLAIIATIIVSILAGGHALWLLPALWVLVLWGGFDIRRAIYDERWSFPRYLLWLIRATAALAGPWVLIITTPLLVSVAGEAWPIAAAGMVVLMLILHSSPDRRILALFDATPMVADEVPGFSAFVNHVAAISPAPRPDLYRIDLDGGYWVNAVAVPHSERPAVLYSQPLLELLEPPEVRAVYAHEVAHLEQYQGRLLLWTRLQFWLLSALALLWVPASRMIGGFSWVVPVAWLALIVLLLRHSMVRANARETDGDSRAVELCGDPEALVSALVKLHTAARLPRRLAGSDEARSTHPSLARRIRAIRETAPSSHQHGDGERPAATVAAAAAAESYVILDELRVSWLDGVPEGTDFDPSALRAAASASRSIPHDQLTELRIRARSADHHELIAVDIHGKRHSTRLDESGVERMQRALDGVDTRLARPTPPSLLSPFARSTGLARWLAVLAIIVSVLLPGGGAIAVLMLMVLIRPQVAVLTAAAAGVLVAALLSLTAVAGAAGDPQPVLLSLGLVSVIGIILAFMAVARGREFADERKSGAWLPAGILGACLVMMWMVALVPATLVGGGAPEALHLHRTVRSLPSLVAFPAAMAAALLAGTGRRQWLTAAAVAVLAVPAPYLGSRAFRAAAVTDPLLIEGPTAGVTRGALEPLLEIELPGMPTMLRSDPGGAAFAVAEWLVADDTDEYGEPVRGPRWKVISRSGRQLLVTDAQDLVFVVGARLITATPFGQDFSGIRLEHLSFTEVGGDPWSIELPFLYNAKLAVESSAECWSLSGTEFSEHGRSEFVRSSGCGGSPDFETSRWSLDTEGGRSIAWTAIDDRVALAQTMHFGDGGFGLGSLLGLLGSPETELLAVSPDSTSSLGSSRLGLSCAAVTGLRPGAFCAAQDGRDAFLWQLEAGQLSVAKKPLAVLRTGGHVMVSWATPEIAVLSVPGEDPLIFDRATGDLTRLDLPGEGFTVDTAPVGPGTLAALIRHDGRTTLSVFQVPD